jgi:ATP-binding cassette subfamily C protein/ATP-binding cassette subfamily C protein EexD
MARALAPVEATVASWKQICSAATAWKNLGELLRRGKLHAGTIRLPQPKGRLHVENVTHVPDGAARPALLGINMEILPGEVLAIVGPSGAGKSTLVKLMVGIAAPTRGCVRLDDADLFLWDRSDLGQHIGYLPQTVELLPGTIKDNIARMQEDADPARVIEAAKVAGVHELILRLPEGYETQIVGEAANLSGGQKQRIGLARALFGNPALVVLDEPNSNLDSVGDEALNQAIHSAKQLGSTVVIVAHRPSLMRYVDKVAILNEGGLHMFGPKAKVLGAVQRVSEIPTAKAS